MEKYQKIILLKFLNEQIWAFNQLAIANGFPINFTVDFDFEEIQKNKEFREIFFSVYSSQDE